jgi:RimJ/RimL family protein N-acetyltransferase
VHPYAHHLPVTRIQATSGPVTLRVPTEAEVLAYVDAIADGGLDDDRTRSSLQWQPPSPEVAAAQTIEHVATNLTRGPGPDWQLPLFVFVAGEPIGRQDLVAADDWEHLRIAKTGSVLLNTERDRGYGTHARACVLEVAWALGARRATTAWRVDNGASARVSTKLGYVTNGTDWWWDPIAGREVELCRAWVTEDRFRAAWTGPVTVTGVDDGTRLWLRPAP